MAARAYRLLDKSLQLVKVLTEAEADTLLASGKVEIRKSHRRESLVLLDNRTVGDFARGCDDASLGGPALQPVYKERQRGRSVVVLKRTSDAVVEPAINQEPAVTEKQFHKWDNELSFEELRAGQIISQAARERKAEAEHRRKYLIQFLACDEYDRLYGVAA